MDKKKFQSYLLLITFGIVLFNILYRFDGVTRAITTLVGVFTPLLYGFAFAFILNPLMKFFEFRVYQKLLQNRSHKKATKLIIPLSLLTTYVAFLLFLSLVIAVLLPEVSANIVTLMDNFPQYIHSFNSFLNHLIENSHLDAGLIEQVKQFGDDLSKNVFNLVSAAAPQVLKITVTITKSIGNIIIGLIISVYMLAGRDKLIKQAKKLVVAFLPQRAAVKTLEISTLANQMFGGFLIGKLIDSLLIGAICCVGATIMQIDNAILISVIIGVTNFVPIFGPIVGAIISIFLILMVSPIQALWFGIFILILQQVDGNIIGPKILGDSIGLPTLWVILAVIVGGGLGGVAGMVLGVPICGVVYILLKQSADKRIQKKSMKINKNSDKDCIEES